MRNEMLASDIDQSGNAYVTSDDKLNDINTGESTEGWKGEIATRHKICFVGNVTRASSSAKFVLIKLLMLMLRLVAEDCPGKKNA